MVSKSMTGLERIKNLESSLPDPVKEDVNKRINDWLLGGGNEDDPYIHQQLRFAKRFVKEPKK